MPRFAIQNLPRPTDDKVIRSLNNMREYLTKVLPCPFCGEQPVTRPRNDDDAAQMGDCVGVVECVNGDCSAQPSVNDGELINDNRGWRAYVDCAVVRWNRRGK